MLPGERSGGRTLAYGVESARMRTFKLILVALAMLVPGVGVTSYDPAVTLCTLDDSRIPESSGFAASSYHDDIAFTHNDSGDTARIFAIHLRTCAVLATITVAGVEAIDWEDIARGPGSHDGESLYIGDIGNNNRTRRTLVIYEIREPVVDPDIVGAQQTVTVIASHEYVYDDGPQDAEGLVIDPASGDIIVVGKTYHGVSGIYRLERVLPEPLPLVARTIARAPLVSTTAIGPQATGADIAPDGSRIVIRTYQEIFEWAIPDGDIASAFSTLGEPISHPLVPQGEAVTFTRDSAGLMTTTEGAGPVYLLTRSG